MPQGKPDVEYLQLPCPMPMVGKSPLAMLQEICKNIGSDLPAENKSQKSMSSNHHQPINSKLKSPSSAKSAQQSKRLSKDSDMVQAKKQISPTNSLPLQPESENDGFLGHYRSNFAKPISCTNITSSTQGFQHTEPFVQQMFQDSLHIPKMTLNNSNYSNMPNESEFMWLANFFYNKIQSSLLCNQHHFSLDPEVVKITAMDSPLMTPMARLISTLEPKVHQCHWVTSEGVCRKTFFTNEELLHHLRNHISDSSSHTISLAQHCWNSSQQDPFTKMVNNRPYKFHPYMANHKSLAPVYF